MRIKKLNWQAWEARPVFRSWDANQEMRIAETPIGTYRLLRRPHLDRLVNVVRWYVDCGSRKKLGPFDHDIDASRAAQADYEEAILLSIGE